MSGFQELFKKLKGAFIWLAIGTFFGMPIFNVVGYCVAISKLNSLSSVSKDFYKARKITTYGIVASCVYMALSAFINTMLPSSLISTANLLIESGEEATLNLIPFYGYICIAVLIVVAILNAGIFYFLVKYVYQGLDEYTNRYLNVVNNECKTLANKINKWLIIFICACWLTLPVNFLDIYYYNQLVNLGGLANEEAYEAYLTVQSNYSFYFNFGEIAQFIIEVIALVHTGRLISFLKKLSLTTPYDSFNDGLNNDSIPVDSNEKNNEPTKDPYDWKEDFK